MIAGALGCDSGGVSFQCEFVTATCPVKKEPCPALPLDSGGCDDIPEVNNGSAVHAGIPVDAGRPYGCKATLPYTLPNANNEYQTCICFPRVLDPDGGERLNWTCGL